MMSWWVETGEVPLDKIIQENTRDTSTFFLMHVEKHWPLYCSDENTAKYATHSDKIYIFGLFVFPRVLMELAVSCDDDVILKFCFLPEGTRWAPGLWLRDAAQTKFMCGKCSVGYQAILGN